MKFKNDKIEIDITPEELRHFRIDNVETFKNFVNKLTEEKKLGFNTNQKEQ